jgi:hypothetical protein
VAEPEKRSGPTPVPEDSHASGPACPVPLCPLCTAATVLGQFRPEVVEHITNATREALLAIRAVIDTRLEESDGKPEADRGRVQRIEIA